MSRRPSPQRIATLLVLCELAPVTATALGEALGVRINTVRVTLYRLRRAGLADCDTTPGVAYRWRLTPAGVALAGGAL